MNMINIYSHTLYYYIIIIILSYYFQCPFVVYERPHGPRGGEKHPPSYMRAFRPTEDIQYVRGHTRVCVGTRSARRVPNYQLWFKHDVS